MWRHVVLRRLQMRKSMTCVNGKHNSDDNVFEIGTSQWWANLKSNLSVKSQIFRQKDLNLYAKSQIKNLFSNSVWLILTRKLKLNCCDLWRVGSYDVIKFSSKYITCDFGVFSTINFCFHWCKIIKKIHKEMRELQSKIKWHFFGTLCRLEVCGNGFLHLHSLPFPCN